MTPPRTGRRRFLQAVSAVALVGKARAQEEDEKQTPAILGGPPARSGGWPGWPVIGEEDVREWIDVLKSGIWNRLDGGRVSRFEQAWAQTLGCEHALAVANGTSALITGLNALEVGPGDEVIIPPYTFVATANAVLLQYALPVFVDTDPSSFQIDAGKVESAVTDRTRAIMPVHVGGAPADLDRLLEVGSRRGLPVVEDACQAHLAEWKGRKVGTLGTMGCFSFQASKNLNCGEGGALVTSDARLDEQARSFQNNGRTWPGGPGLFARNGANLRLTEFQGALLLTQMTRLEDQATRRQQNGDYLASRLSEIPGIRPAKPHGGCTRNAYHLFMFRYDSEEFAGLSRARFLEALMAEGVPASGGYTPLNREPFLEQCLSSRGFRSVFGEKALADYRERIACPENDRLCKEAVWLGQTMLLGPRSDMDRIVTAIQKIHRHADRIARA